MEGMANIDFPKSMEARALKHAKKTHNYLGIDKEEPGDFLSLN